MKLFRAVFFPLLLAFVLLFAQQSGAMHTLRHALEEQTQHDKQTPYSHACEQCAAYGQLGNALSSACHSFTAIAVSAEAVRHRSTSLCSIHILAAVARGPPALLQTIA